jgi:hypothetical protein
MQPDTAFSSFLRRQNLTRANYTHRIPAVFVARNTFTNVLLPLAMRNIAFATSYFHALQRFLYPNGTTFPPLPPNNNGTDVFNTSSSSSTGADSSSSSSTAGVHLRRRLLEDSSNSSSSSSSSSGGGDDGALDSSSSSGDSGGDDESSSSSSSTGGGFVPRRATDVLPFVPLFAVLDVRNTVDPDAVDSGGGDGVDYGGIRLGTLFHPYVNLFISAFFSRLLTDSFIVLSLAFAYFF